MSSFQKRRATPVMPGAKQSLHNGQQLISTGNAALDHILGGGLPIGSILLIEEDRFNRYSNYLAKFYLAEGGIHKHATFLASLDADPNDMLKTLPRTIPITHSSEPNGTSNKSSNDMRIAWRYNKLDMVDSEQGGDRQVIGENSYYFDLSQSIEEDVLNQLDLTVFKNEKNATPHESSQFYNPLYGSLLSKLKKKISSEDTFGITSDRQQQTAGASNTNDEKSTKNKNLLRICLHSVGSPLWWDENFTNDLCLFLLLLKSLVRNSLSVCCVTMPTHLFQFYDETLINRVRNLVDYVVQLESFAGSNKETNVAFKEYHGLFYIRKLAALNALAAHTPETYDLAFKLRRKRFVIEKLHLPPELQESEQREQDDENILSAMACGSADKHLLEF